MKLVLDDKAKHRLVGIAVLLSIIVVFAPAVLKKSQQRFEETVSVSVRLPPKPSLPKVTTSLPKALFQATKVAAVDIPKVDRTAVKLNDLAQAKRLSQPQVAVSTVVAIDAKRETVAHNNVGNSSLVHTIAQATTSVQQNVIKEDVSVIPKIDIPTVTQSQSHRSNQQIEPVKKSVLKPIAQSAPAQHTDGGNYGVQLASFAKQSNAVALVAKLKKQGYDVNYFRFQASQTGATYYKVVVGGLAGRDQAQKIQKQLAQALQLKGFVVAQGTT